MGDNFKVCGLCSQLVDESVHLSGHLETFLREFLSGSISDLELPDKICTDCYSGTSEAKRFQDRCVKAILKLQKSHLNSTMILGGKSPSGAAGNSGTLTPASSKPKKGVTPQSTPVTTPSNKKVGGSNKKKSSNLGLGESITIERLPPTRSGGRRSQESLAREPSPLPPRASGARGGGAGASPAAAAKKSGGKTKAHDQPVVFINKNERKLADDALKKQGCSYSTSSTTTTPSTTKRRGPKGKNTPATTPAPIPPPTPSRSGRSVKRNVKYIEEVDLDGAPVKVASPAASPPAKRKRSSLPPKSPPAEVIETTAEDDAEIFPSIGPYQCEICQQITDTKLEFVNHIKKFHRSVVDEEVLKSLEHDLQKVKQKQARQKQQQQRMRPLPPPAPKAMPKQVPGGNKKRGRPSGAAEAAKKEADLAKRTCNKCHALVPKASDMKKHQNTKACKQTAEMLSKPNHDAVVVMDIDEGPEESVAERTCQYCNKVVAKVKDLEGHYTTKACQAKKYEMEKNNSSSALTTTITTDFDGGVTVEDDQPAINPLEDTEDVSDPFESVRNESLFDTIAASTNDSKLVPSTTTTESTTNGWNNGNSQNVFSSSEDPVSIGVIENVGLQSNGDMSNNWAVADPQVTEQLFM